MYGCIRSVGVSWLRPWRQQYENAIVVVDECVTMASSVGKDGIGSSPNISAQTLTASLRSSASAS